MQNEHTHTQWNEDEVFFILRNEQIFQNKAHNSAN